MTEPCDELQETDIRWTLEPAFELHFGNVEEFAAEVLGDAEVYREISFALLGELHDLTRTTQHRSEMIRALRQEIVTLRVETAAARSRRSRWSRGTTR